jgi:hypothetical protein
MLWPEKNQKLFILGPILMPNGRFNDNCSQSGDNCRCLLVTLQTWWINSFPINKCELLHCRSIPIEIFFHWLTHIIFKLQRFTIFPNHKFICSARNHSGIVPKNSVCSVLQQARFLRRAIAQAVSCPLPTAAARVRAQVRSCGICGGQKWHWDRFSPSTSVSPGNSHSTDCSTFIIIIIIIHHPGRVQ